MGIIGAIVGFLAGVAVAYSLVEKRLKKQKQEYLQQSRRIAQDIELAQISRMQQNADSQDTEGEDRHRKATVEHENLLRQVTNQYENQLQQIAAQHENQLQQVLAERDSQLQQVTGAHENQLRQVSQELEAAHNARLQESLQSLQAEHEHHLLRVADELHYNYQAQIEEHLQNLQNEHEIRLRQTAEEYENREVEMQLSIEALQEQYESQLQAANEQLQAHEAQMQATIMSLQQQYENNVQQQEVPPQQSSELNQTEVGEYLPQPEVWQEQSSELNQTEVEQDLNNTDFLEPQSIDLERQAEVEQQPQTARQSPTYSVAQLMGFVQSQDTETRKFAASALGQMAAANALRTDTQRAIETLGKLAGDFQPEVREAAVEALAMIKSEKVIPLLEKALRDTDSAVAVAASAAINKFKFYPPAADVKPKILDLQKPKD
ncbi:HEAT repeat domain-containing protein [Microcoleus sp. LEGE 07076]|uniref:HEAT repeat domain-containing protein n=1 Tax=Microcoleus sp. LEGE 07076 TaxID=915322 RepID=UPI00187E9C3C|nr:HEAT repeat domain-containing protein [Microcoleus sp. LEGE 07076]